MKVTYYQRPNGRKAEIQCKNVYPADEHYFITNNIKLSMEELSTGEIVVYAHYGNDDDELIEFAGIKTCEETLSVLRKRLEKKLCNNTN